MELRIVRHTDRFDDACHFCGSVLGWPITENAEDPREGAFEPPQCGITGGATQNRTVDLILIRDAL
jgi:hypothetical protein